MNKEFFANKRIVILGLARQGSALARFMRTCGATVIVSDVHNSSQLEAEINELRGLGIEYVLGAHPLSLLDGCDLLALSGGVPPQIPIVQEAIARGIPLTNDSLLTLQLARSSGLGPIVAITGSSGKTTTTTLVGEMLSGSTYTDDKPSKSESPVHVGGNIGVPLIDKLDEINPGEPIVLELSSFQLELFDADTSKMPLDGMGPDVAALLNITPNHLDRHPGMANYTDAKLNLLRCLPATAKIVLSLDDPVTAAIGATEKLTAKDALPAKWQLSGLLDEITALIEAGGQEKIFFSRTDFSNRPGVENGGAWQDGDKLLLNGQKICGLTNLQLRGAHNVTNVLAAAAISNAAGATTEMIKQTATKFTGVAHRLEVVAKRNGVLWINDSIATSPERALAGLRSFDSSEHAVILLAGGKDKNLPWQSLADEVLNNVSYLIGFGAYGPEFVRMVQERGDFDQRSAPSSATANQLDQAIELAARLVESERAANPDSEVVVLLSPGGTSYDAYKDFEERGEHFRKLVKALEN